MAILRPIPVDILAAEESQRLEIVDYIETLIDGATLTTVMGSNNDLYFGGSIGQRVNAGSGNDVVQMGLGDDNVTAGDGDDYVLAGAGVDVIYGGSGNDFLFGEGGNDFINGDDGDDVIFGGAGLDTLSGWFGNDVMYGNAGADKMHGGDGADILDGGAAADVIDGGYGDDEVIGGIGNDNLSGGADNDYIYGGAGVDRLSGGNGSDVFYLAALTEIGDLYTDFGSVDKIQINSSNFGVAAGTSLVAGETLLFGTGLSAVTDSATIMFDTVTRALTYDVDGTGAAAAVQLGRITNYIDLSSQNFEFI